MAACINPYFSPYFAIGAPPAAGFWFLKRGNIGAAAFWASKLKKLKYIGDFDEFRFLSWSRRILWNFLCENVSYVYLLANAIDPTYECAILRCPTYLSHVSDGPTLTI